MTPTSYIIEQPIETAIDVDMLKKHLRIDNDYEDDILQLIIESATERIEEYIDMKLIKQKWGIFWDDLNKKKSDEPWWDGTREMAIGALYECNSVIELPFGKVLGDDYSFNYVDEDGNNAVYNESFYKVDGYSKQSRLSLIGGNTWPSTATPINGYRFEAYFGFGEDGKRVPSTIKQALLIFCAEIYENKGDEKEDIAIPVSALALLATHRSIKIG